MQIICKVYSQKEGLSFQDLDDSEDNGELQYWLEKDYKIVTSFSIRSFSGEQITCVVFEER